MAKKKSVRDTYIIRIYSRDKTNPSNIIGIIEEIGKEEKKSFRNLNELWNILNSSNVKAKPKRSKMSTR